MPHASFEPSRPAVRRVRGDSGGIRPMAQRFFSGSGITPLTGAMPAGSGGIGGEQTGIYPAAAPGGWQLIGRTPLALFDPARTPPTLLQPGDRVRFIVAGVHAG